MKKKLISIILTIVMCIIPMSICFAGYGKVEVPSNGGDSLGNIGGTVNTVLGVIQTIGYIVAVAMVMWVGIKYLMSGAGERAKVKDTMIPIVIGAIIIMAAVTITSFAFKAFTPN